MAVPETDNATGDDRVEKLLETLLIYRNEHGITPPKRLLFALARNAVDLTGTDVHALARTLEARGFIHPFHDLRSGLRVTDAGVHHAQGRIAAATLRRPAVR